MYIYIYIYIYIYNIHRCIHSFIFLNVFSFPFFSLYVHEIQYNENMNTHTCLFLNKMSKYMHTYINPIYIHTQIHT